MKMRRDYIDGNEGGDLSQGQVSAARVERHDEVNRLVVGRARKLSDAIEFDAEAERRQIVVVDAEGTWEPTGIRGSHHVTSHRAQHHVTEIEHVVRKTRPAKFTRVSTTIFLNNYK